ncbi:aminoglycoside phosphotransferase family protein [Arthrobacter castelli]|uniref:aminoglycoside phosphotransferase family protein n=1 Tax=Arthrobacter castelli TaxID=271431 RepID=UPI000416596C|nr:aminoglycoside phosphotransferase family protein [Arthrobacter castelli]
MANLPAAEVEVSEQLVRRLLTDQHPDLGGLPLKLQANGWDNAIYRLGDDLTVRLPRRQQAAGLIVNEQHWLPVFAQWVKVQLPVPVRVGEPTPYYPWSWSVCPWFRGTLASEVPRNERTAFAEELADFLIALHRPAPEHAPANPVRGVPLATRRAAVAQRLGSGGLPGAADLAKLWDELSAAPDWSGPPLWLHGDLHAANIVYGEDALSAVIDFGDLTAGDPATDLATAWLTFDAEGRGRFQNRVGRKGVDADTWKRARAWALSMSTAMLAASDDHPGMRVLGEESLEQVLGHNE